jgi:hypothetical protein
MCVWACGRVCVSSQDCGACDSTHCVHSFWQHTRTRTREHESHTQAQAQRTCQCGSNTASMLSHPAVARCAVPPCGRAAAVGESPQPTLGLMLSAQLQLWTAARAAEVRVGARTGRSARCVCVCACVHACVRACARACVRVFVCVCVVRGCCAIATTMAAMCKASRCAQQNSTHVNTPPPPPPPPPPHTHTQRPHAPVDMGSPAAPASAATMPPWCHVGVA